MSIPSETPAAFPPTQTYREWQGRIGLRARARGGLRAATLRFLAVGREIGASSGWIRFPYYHHVFDDERAGFRRQLRYLRNFGEFVTLDAAVALIEGGMPIDGRYFCLTFDDGLKCCASGALPELVELNIPAAFYVVADLVGRSFAPDHPIARDVFSFKAKSTSLDFLDWGECRQLVGCGMTIGSHSATHARLVGLDDVAARAEIDTSKATIEREVHISCAHFCAPYGMPGIDFHETRDVALVRAAGYRSFATGRRGPNRRGDDPMRLRRDHLLANWDLHQVRYFLSRG